MTVIESIILAIILVSFAFAGLMWVGIAIQRTQDQRYEQIAGLKCMVSISGKYVPGKVVAWNGKYIAVVWLERKYFDDHELFVDVSTIYVDPIYHYGYTPSISVEQLKTLPTFEQYYKSIDEQKSRV